jgi:predicted ArsR family transcriptional regulator
MAIDELTSLERRQVEMEYVVPLVRDLQAILGEKVVNDALAERTRRNVEAARQAPAPDIDLSDLAAGMDHYAAGDALEYEVLAAERDRFDLDVTRCEYATLMERLGARDIGHLLICNMDYKMAAELGTELTRTGTCMQGADRCDFRFRKR